MWNLGKIEICCDLIYICGVLYLGYVNLDVLYLVNEMDDLLIVVFRFKWDIIESI